ncbi:hypothetical protein A6V39_03595 [Candidatus Mycoplasma haematobovis]|uniref:Uncharacterized protein n=1 Tax=Candidatus Mycoplasma haematobovis TaxID=432608 RepID=A0A1A9QE54_9MOLU|nr:hypothetical protein [Candidatus Mycoplasma haematobovis]OAL09970.1 hypothetical protein A6V39_03595 [Candidatus Mycoplasma haematobovis]
MANTSLLTKVVGTVLVGGGIAGAGTAYALSSNQKAKTTIENKLNEEQKELLDGEVEALWEIKLTTYKRIKAKDNTFELTPLSWQGLKNWCSTNKGKENNETNQKIYERVKEVCIVPTYKEKLLKENKQLAEDTQDWTNRTNDYKQSGNNLLIDGIDRANPGNDALKNWCTNTILNSKFTTEDKNYNLAVKWCTKTGT